MSLEIINHDGRRCAEIIWANTTVEKSTFFSPEESSFQFGLLAHDSGFVEPAHYHPRITRTIEDLQQMFVVQRGAVAVDFYTEDGRRFREVILRAGDAIVIIAGVHAIRVLEKMQCVSIKQGPFLGVENDKINVEVRR